MTWEIIAGLIALVTVGIAIGKIIYNNTAAMTKLSCSVDALTQKMNEQTERIEKLDSRVAKIEIQIAKGE